MAHIIDAMTSINGHLNMIAKWYDDKSSNVLRDIQTPSFVEVAVDRMVELHPSCIIDSNKDIEIYKTVLSDTGDPFNPIYITILNNCNTVLVDKVPLYINKGSNLGSGVGYIVAVPDMMFRDNTDILTCVELLNNLYFKLLELDSNMKYAPGIELIKHSKNEKLNLSTYDLEMIYIALGCSYVNLRAWFTTMYGKNNIDASYVLSIYDEKDIPENLKKGIIDTINKHCNMIGNLKDSIGNGSLIMDALYE